MSEGVRRQTVDLSKHPDMVVVYLGMRVKSLRGLTALAKFGKRTAAVFDADPDGLLHYERIIFSLLPPHMGMRQYWRDFDALEEWARSPPHREWWKEFVRDPEETEFWHEAYSMSGGVDAIYDYVDSPIGMMNCLPVVPAEGNRYSARERIGAEGEPDAPPALSEEELEGEDTVGQKG